MGSRGREVAALQRKLNLIPDGIFGPLTGEALRQFQKDNGLVPDGIAGPKTLNALGLIPPENPRIINKIIIHCSATPEGRDVSADTIRQWHLARGFKEIGYHYVIYRDGTVVPGRSEAVVGAHTSGVNSNSLGICYVGGMSPDNKFPKDTRTPRQKDALCKLVAELRQKYPGVSVHGHNEFAKKACPSFYVIDDPVLCGR